jgi:hypothetical protein
VCQPAVVVDHVYPPNGLAIDGSTLFFTADDSLLSCALPHCTTPKQLANGYVTTGPVVIANHLVAFVAGADNFGIPYQVVVCPETGCPSTDVSLGGVGIGSLGLLSNGTDVVFRGDGGRGGPTGLIICLGVTATGCTQLRPSPVQFDRTLGPLALDGQTVSYFPNDADQDVDYVLGACGPLATCTQHMGTKRVFGATPGFAAHAGRMYIAPQPYTTSSGYVGISPGDIISCNDVDCSSESSFVSHFGRTIGELAVDDSGVTWLEAGGAGLPQSVERCPLQGCVGGATVMARDLPATANNLLVADGFVYWAEPNQSPDGGTTATRTARIMRVAR